MQAGQKAVAVRRRQKPILQIISVYEDLMTSFVYYNTPTKQFSTHYSQPLPFTTEKITTHLPKNIALIRAVAALAFTALVACKLSAPLFFWPVVLIGASFAGWTIYTHIFDKDPMLEAFYQIVGGKENFEKLPLIELKKSPKIHHAITALKWEEIQHPISRAKTPDGRNIIIVKGLTRYLDNSFKNSQVKSNLAFLERMGPYDIAREEIRRPEIVDATILAICPPFKENTFGRRISYTESARSDENYSSFLFSSITKEMANEFYVQLSAREPVYHA